MSIYITKNGQKEKLNIPASDVQILDIDGKFKSGNLEDALKEVGSGTETNMLRVEEKVGQLENDKTNILNKIDGVNTQLSENVQQISERLKIGRHYLSYKNSTTTIWGSEVNVCVPPTQEQYNHLAFQGVDCTLGIQLTIATTTGMPTMYNDTHVIQSLQYAKNAGVKTTQIKLHLAPINSLNYNDYKPDLPTFFSTWKSIVLHYAGICNSNGIKILCFGCEMYNQSIDANYSYWQDIVNTTRATYPNLLLTYAGSGYEQMIASPRKIWNLVDFIGFNMYFSYGNKLASQKPSVDDSIMKAFYRKYLDASSAHYIINFYANKFNKKIYVTETGLMPRDEALIKYYNDDFLTGDRIHDGQAVAMKACFDGLFQNENIIGFSWWCVNYPFHYFDYNADFDANAVSIAEQVMHDYIKGGLI